MKGNKAVAERPLDCMVGCSTCGVVCPVQAISFPDGDLIWKLEREHKIFKVVRQEAQEKATRQNALKARSEAEKVISQVTTRVRVELAGEFGEKRFLVKIEDLIKDRPYDVVNLRLEVPTVKGALEKTPSLMSFEVTTTDQSDVEAFMGEVRALVRENGLVLVNETKL
jgi:ferredoxin